MIRFLKITQIGLGSIPTVNSLHPRRCAHHAASTIYALSSGQGKCGVAVIRISGPESSSVLSEMAGLKKLPEPRKALLKHLRHPKNRDVLDQGLVLWFPGPNSFTGEDSCELQIHGGLATVSIVLSALSHLPGFRPALPGEFTKRAFYSNKLDLTEVEGLADLINAETEIQRKQALHQLEGSLFTRYTQWAQHLKRSVAHVEAYIDFSEDQNIEEDILHSTNQELKVLLEKIQEHLADGRRGERTRDGVRTAIVGAPNVGKSSLLNALSERPAAIVSSIPGTTRDVISTTLDIAGFPITISDTAGLHAHTQDPVEHEGMLRAHRAVSQSDLILLVVDSTYYLNWLRKHPSSEKHFKHFLLSYIKQLNLENTILSCSNITKVFDLNKNCSSESVCLIVMNKVDLVEESCVLELCKEYPEVVCVTSCSGEVPNLKALLDNLQYHLNILCSEGTREAACLTQARHRHHLNVCVSCINRYLSVSTSESQIDQAAQHLRQAINALGHITGHVSTEQILDQIFSDFCIGK